MASYFVKTLLLPCKLFLNPKLFLQKNKAPFFVKLTCDKYITNFKKNGAFGEIIRANPQNIRARPTPSNYTFIKMKYACSKSRPPYYIFEIITPMFVDRARFLLSYFLCFCNIIIASSVALSSAFFNATKSSFSLFVKPLSLKSLIPTR